MIYVIDNGESYSDHQLHFVQTNLTLEQVTLLLRDTDHHVVLVAEHYDLFTEYGNIGSTLAVAPLAASIWTPRPPRRFEGFQLTTAGRSLGNDLLRAIVKDLDNQPGAWALWAGELGVSHARMEQAPALRNLFLSRLGVAGLE